MFNSTIFGRVIVLFILIAAYGNTKIHSLTVKGQSGGPGLEWGAGNPSYIKIAGTLHQANNAFVRCFSVFSTTGSLTQKSGSSIYIDKFSQVWQGNENSITWTMEEKTAVNIHQYCQFVTTDSVVMRPSSRIKLRSSSSFYPRAYVDMGPSSSIELDNSAYLLLSCGGAACVIGEKSSITLGIGCWYYALGSFSLGESCLVDTDRGAYIRQYGSLQLDGGSKMAIGSGAYIEQHGSLQLGTLSNMAIGRRSSVYVYDDGEISIDKNSNITTGYRSMLHIGGLSVLRLARQTKVELGVSSKFDISYGSKVLMEIPGASITVGDRAVFSVQGGSVCLVFRNVVIPSGEVVSASGGQLDTNVPPGMTCYTVQEYYGE